MLSSRNLLILLISTFLVGCLEQPPVPKISPSPTPTPVPKSTPNPTISHLDTDGMMLAYSDHTVIRDYLIQRLAAYRSFLNYTPMLSGEKGRKVKEQLAEYSSRFAEEFLEGFQSYGDSIKSAEGFFVKKKFLAIENACPVLQPFASMEASDVTGPTMVPADTDLLIFQEIDPEKLIEVSTSFVNRLQIPGINISQDQIKAEIEQAAGGSYDLAEFGSQIALVVRLTADTIRIPGLDIAIPKPQFALILYPPNDRLAGRLVANIGDSQEVEKSESNGMTFLSQKLPPGSPADRITFGIAKNFILIGSDDQLVRDIVDAKSGKNPPLGSNSEFQRLAKDMPGKANSYFYSSPAFQDTLQQVKSGLDSGIAENTPVAQRATLISINLYISGFGKALNGYGVSSRVQGGYYTIAHTRTSEYVDLMAIALSSMTAVNTYLSQLLLNQK
jgi:hypothetical protein